MIIGHFSDLHGDLEPLRRAPRVPDAWACTGDFFPNTTMGVVEVETRFQPRWFATVAKEMVALLRGRPLLWLRGNHDYVDLAELLLEHGHLRAHNVAHYEAPMVVRATAEDKIAVAAFEGIPYIAGVWATEMRQGDLATRARRAFDAAGANVLLTHAHPHGVLGHGIEGIMSVAGRLMYDEHAFAAHLFGHIHECGGMSARVGPRGTLCVNSARTLQFVELKNGRAEVVA